MALDHRIRYEDAAVKAAVTRLARSLPIGGSMKPVMREFGRIGVSEVRQRFRDEETPDGVPWLPSQRVEREGGQTLTMTARLRRSFTWQADNASTAIGTNVVYAAAQNFGRSRTASIFEQLKAGAGASALRGRGIPAREFMGFSDEGKLQLVEAVNGFLSRSWAGR